MQRALLITGLSALLAQPALAAGMMPPANLLPPGYVPTAEQAPTPLPTASANDDAERSGMGEADLSATETPQSATADYVDIPALTPMSQTAPQATAPQATANPAYYTQGITTGPKAYNEGNFTFKAQ